MALDTIENAGYYFIQACNAMTAPHRTMMEVEKIKYIAKNSIGTLWTMSILIKERSKQMPCYSYMAKWTKT